MQKKRAPVCPRVGVRSRGPARAHPGSPRREGSGLDSMETSLWRGERPWGPSPCWSVLSQPQFPPQHTLGLYTLPADTGLTSMISVRWCPESSVGFGDQEGRTWRNFPPKLEGNAFGMRSTQLRTSNPASRAALRPLKNPLGRRGAEQAVNGTVPLRRPLSSLFTKRSPSPGPSWLMSRGQHNHGRGRGSAGGAGSGPRGALSKCPLHLA